MGPIAAVGAESAKEAWSALRILYVVNVDWFFLSHRLPLARAARARGADVYVAAADTGHAKRIRDEGFTFIPLPMSRKGTHPWEQARSVLFLLRLYRRLQPSLIHHVTIKPVLYGSVAARLAGTSAVVNAISGLGYVFSSDRGGGPLRALAEGVYRVALRRGRTIFQNPEDRAQFVAAGMVRGEDTVLIRGSGADCARFAPRPIPPGPPVVALPSRMLWEKGVGTFVEAARLLRARGRSARFVLVGPTDENPTAVPEAQLRAWQEEGVVEWWGSRDDMPGVMAAASVVALPTYYKEGVPKVLLEAAASGRPIVTTDIPGCREVVHDGVNGFLIPPKDVAALADAIDRLLASPELRARLGAVGRERALAEFSEEIVVEQTMRLYDEVLGAAV